jgi:hypothetical protein
MELEGQDSGNPVTLSMALGRSAPAGSWNTRSPKSGNTARKWSWRKRIGLDLTLGPTGRDPPRWPKGP